MRIPPTHGVLLLGLASGCSLLGFYDEPPTRCPEDPLCCSTGDPMANGGCDWTCNDAVAPDFRLTAMEVAPGAPASAPFRSAIEDAVGGGGLVWLIDLASTGATTIFRTGSGTCVDPGVCQFDDAHPSSAGTATLGDDGVLVLPATGTFDAEVVVDAPILGAAFVLRLRECALVGPLTAAGNCIGRRDDGTGAWTTQADLTCRIVADDAKAVDLSAQNLSLCDLLAGCGELFCCDAPLADWPNATDAVVDGAPAWTLQARVAAIGARIAAE